MRRKGFTRVDPIVLPSGIKEGGTQVNISNQGLITLGSGLVKQLGISSFEDDVWSVDILSNRKDTILIELINKVGDFNIRKGGKVNCIPLIRNLGINLIDELISQEKDEDGKVDTPSKSFKQTKVITENNEKVIEVVIKEV